MMYDEISFDRELEQHHQEELIRRYCTTLEEALKRAQTKEEAKTILDSTCNGFERSCESEVVSRFLRRHAEQVYGRIWGS